MDKQKNTGPTLNERWRQWRERFRQRLIFERDWLIDFIGAIRGGLFIRNIILALFRLPGRLWNGLTEQVWLWRRSAQARPSLSMTAWLVRGVPVVVLAALLVVTYYALSQRTRFEQFPIFVTAPQQRILVIHGSTDDEGEETYANAIQALDYAHLPHDQLNLAERKIWPDLSQYSTLLLITGHLDQLDSGQEKQITDFVANGGGLAVLYRTWNPNLAPLFGIAGRPAQPERIEDEWGLQFHTDFFPGVKNLFLDPEITGDHLPYDLPLQPEAEIVASSTTGRPIAWLSRYEQGRTVFWNTPFLSQKETRGFIVQSVVNVQGVGVLPLANLATIQIDGFPAACTHDRLEPIHSEYDLSLADFYHQVWLPDMLQIARRYGLVYTFLLSFSDNKGVAPPFDFQDWEQARLEVAGQELFYSRHTAHISAQQGELGLSGYNHTPLTLQDWPDEQSMLSALEAAAARWEADNLYPRPVTYAPPDNRYDPTGAGALTKTFPSLKVISGLYHQGQFEQGGDREFGPEPWNPALFSLPRATSGYNMSSAQRLATLSELGTMGAWTHFIRPSGLFDTPQNNPDASEYGNPHSWGWREDQVGGQNGFYYRFLRWLNFVQTYYPWLRYTRTDEAGEMMQAYLANQIMVALKPYEVTLQSTTPTYFQIRINDGRRVDLNTIQGAQFIHLYHGEGYTIYTLQGLEKEVRLQLLIPETAQAKK